MEVSVEKWFAQAWKDKIAGWFTNSTSSSGDKLNTIQRIVTFVMQQVMIWVGNAMFPSANYMVSMNSINGTWPETHNRMGSFIGAMPEGFQVNSPEVPSKGSLETAELYGNRVAEITLRFLRIE